MYKSNGKNKVIRFVKGENYHIPNNAKVKMIKAGNRIIIKNSWKSNSNLKHYKKLPGGKYEDKNTNTIKEYKKSEYKSKVSINKNMKQLKLLLLCNFLPNHNTLFLTLTCRNDVTDIKEIREYTRQFIRRLKRKYQQYEFLYVYKFERGSSCTKWHVHILLRDTKNKEIANVITNEDITELWKQGFTCIKQVKKRRICFSQNDLKGLNDYE